MINTTLILILILIKFNKNNVIIAFIQKYHYSFHNLINYYSIGIITHISIGILFKLNYRVDCIIFIFILFLIIKVFYVFFFIKSFILIFISSCILFLTNWRVIEKIIISVSNFDQVLYVHGDNEFFYIIGYCLFLCALCIFGYLREVNLRVNFYLLQHLVGNCFNKKLLDDTVYNLKDCFFIVDLKTGKIKYTNKTYLSMLKNLENCDKNNENKTTSKQPIKHEKNYEQSDNLQASGRIIHNVFIIFKNNSFDFDENFNISNKSTPKDICFYDKETLQTEKILNNFVHINESLPNNVVQFLRNYKLITKTSKNMINKNFRNLYSGGTNEDTIKFDMIRFCNLIKQKSTINNNYASTNDFNSINKKSDLKSITNRRISLSNKNLYELNEERMNQFQRSNSSTKKNKEFSRKAARTKTIQIKSKSTISDISEKTTSSFEEFTYLGIVKTRQNTCLNGQNSNNNLMTSKELHVYFRLNNDNSELEFLFEDLSSIIKKERKETVMTCRSLYLSKISHEFKNPICNILEICSYISDEINTKNPKNFNLDSCNGLDSNSDNSDCDNQSRQNSLLRSKKINSNKSINLSISMLKTVCDMMLHLIKDFAFYSTITVEEEENCKIESTKLLRLDNSAGHSQICNYREIIQDLVNMFNIKGKIDNKDHKVFIQEKFDTDLRTQFIDCDKDIFTALIFNLLCHFYKVTHSGTVTISVSDCDAESVDKNGNPHRKLLFDISVSGVLQSNILGTFLKNDEFVKFMVYDNIDENIDEERSSSRDSQISRKIKISEEENKSSHEIENANAKNNFFIRTENHKFTLSPNQNVHNTDNFLVENYHLQNLFDANDIGERNNIIDQFNNNFHIYIAHLYSKRLGYKLIIETPEKKKQLNSPKNRNIENITPSANNIQYNSKIDSRISFFVNVSVDNNSNTLNMPLNNSNSIKNAPNNAKIIKSPLLNFGISSLSPVKKAIRRNTVDSCIFKFKREKNNLNILNSINIQNNINNLNNTNTAKLFSLLNTNRKSLDHSYQFKRKLKFNQLNHPFSYLQSPNILNTISYNNSCHSNFGSPMYTQSIYSNYSEKTISNSGELVFNYPYFMNLYKNISNMSKGYKNSSNNNLRHRSINTVHSNLSQISEKECFVNNGSIVINLYQTNNSQSNQSSVINLGSNTSNIKRDLNNCTNNNLQKTPQTFNSSYKKNPKVYRMPRTTSKNNSSVTLGKIDIGIEGSEITSKDCFRIIVCDDESLIRKMLSRYFDLVTKENPKLMFEVTHSENGFDCLNMIYKNYNENKFFDILIIDETMPFFKGSQIIYLLKTAIAENSLKNIIIISFTAYDSPERKEYIYSQGADYVITKPIKLDDFKTFLFEVVIKEQFEESYILYKQNVNQNK